MFLRGAFDWAAVIPGCARFSDAAFSGREASVIPGWSEGLDPESRDESSLLLDSGFTPSACAGMTGEFVYPGMTAANGCTLEGDGACDNSRSHRYCATLVS